MTTDPLGINQRTNQVEWFNGHLYCKTPDSLGISALILTELGYALRDQRFNPDSLGNRTPVEFERTVSPMWLARLRYIRRAKCNSCSKYERVRDDLYAVGRTCSHCGAVQVHPAFTNAMVSFSFRAPRPENQPHKLFMRLIRFDQEAGYLYLDRRYSIGELTEEQQEQFANPNQAEAWFGNNPELWESAEVDGVPAYRIQYTGNLETGYTPDSNPIQMHNVYEMGQQLNFTLVKVFDGQEYPDGTELPLPGEIAIYEAWRWAPLPSSPQLATTILREVGIDPRPGWDDREVILTRERLADLRRFIDQFTTLSVRKWDRAAPNFPNRGDSALWAVARFCHPDSEL